MLITDEIFILNTQSAFNSSGLLISSVYTGGVRHSDKDEVPDTHAVILPLLLGSVA